MADNSATFSISGRLIGPDQPPYIIAELSANHCQDSEVAKKIIKDCAAAGVDAIKLQTYTADTITLDVSMPDYVVQEGTWAGENLYSLYSRAMTPWEWTSNLMTLANESGITLFSTPFDPSAVDYLEACSVPAYKIASFELTYHQLLARVAKTGKPIILSTGLATQREIQESIDVLTDNGADQIALLKCTSSYPAQPSDLNLSLIPTMQRDFNLTVGYSDHTIGITAATAAVSIGADIVEKHVKDASSIGSADESFSTLASEMADLVDSCQLAQRMRGKPEYGPTQSEIPSLHFRRSVVAAEDLNVGDVLTQKNIVVRRPAIGAEPKTYDFLVGRSLRRSIRRGGGIEVEDV